MRGKRFQINPSIMQINVTLGGLLGLREATVVEPGPCHPQDLYCDRCLSARPSVI